MFNDKSGLRNGMTSCSQKNRDSIYSIIIVAFVFDRMVKNAHYKPAFDIVILSHNLERWYEVSQDIRLGHLLFAMEQWPLYSCAKRSVNLLFIIALWKAAFRHLMHDRMLPVLFGSLIQKMFSYCPACAFFRSITNRKHL